MLIQNHLEYILGLEEKSTLAYVFLVYTCPTCETCASSPRKKLGWNKFIPSLDLLYFMKKDTSSSKWKERELIEQ